VADPDGLADVNQKAREALGLVGLAGLEGTIAANLSHGDQRLLEMAIALATSPRLLMLDEPLAGLSPAERTRTVRLIRSLAGEHTIVLIEHDIDRVLELSDRITVMHQGKVIAQGSPEEIQRNQAVQEAYLGHAQLEEVRLAARAPRAKAGEVLLSVDALNAYYGKGHVLRDVSLEVREGEAVCLLGRNGVGKTTTLSSVLGLVRPKTGRICFKGKDIAGWPPYAIGRLGIGLVPQGRRIFPNLTVVDNLRIARRADNNAFWNMNQVLAQFPKLAELKDRRGENLSGGELQMLAIARALMGNPQLLLLDEAMEGLAPAIVAEVAHMIQQVRGKTTILLVEQSAPLALALCDRAYVMSRGEIIYAGAAGALAGDQALQNRLLGV
jgi:ABC-type branched-subunit amino acid transport system ATPase component